MMKKIIIMPMIVVLLVLVGCQTKYENLEVYINENKIINLDFNCTKNSPAIHYCGNMYRGCTQTLFNIYCKEAIENRSEAIRLNNFSIVCDDEYYSQLETFCIRKTNECLGWWSKEIGERFNRFEDPRECVLANKSDYDNYFI